MADVTNTTLVRDTFIQEVEGELSFARAVIFFETSSNPYASLTVFNNAAVPQPGDNWSANHKALVLMERNFHVVGIDPGPPKLYKMKCECIYRLKHSEAADNLNYALRGTSSLSQDETIRDVAGDVIEIENPDPDKTDKKSFDTIVQMPRIISMRSRRLDTAAPEVEAQSWVGHVNQNAWRGFGPRQWLCTHVSFELIKPPESGDIATYQFDYEFERTPRTEGWVYDMKWRSSDGSLPEGTAYPNGIGAGTGITTFEFHQTKQFEDVFP